MIIAEINIVLRSKVSLVAVKYKHQIYSHLSQENRARLLKGKRVLVSNKKEKLSPFEDTLIAVEFRGMYVAGQFLIGRFEKDRLNLFLSHLKECNRVNVQNKYGLVKNYTSIKDYLKEYAN